MRIIPNPEKIGEYTGVLVNENPLKEIEAELSRNPGVTRLVIGPNIGLPQDRLFHMRGWNDGINIVFATLEEIEKLEKEINIPKWILSDNNFQKAIDGDYMAIRPVTAEFVTTLNCNFRCVQCSYSKPKALKGVWLDEANPKRFCFNFDKTIHMIKSDMLKSLNGLIEGGIRNILFTGGGEPLMNADITLEGMGYAKKHGVTVALYTNGSLLNERIIDELLTIEPLFVRVSIYGDRPGFTAYTRQHEIIFDRVIKNVKLLASKKLTTDSATKLGLSYLIHPCTIKGVGGFVDNLLSTFLPEELNQIDFIRFTPAVDYFGGQQHPQADMEGVFTYIEEEIKPRFVHTTIEIKPYYHRLQDLNQPKSYSKCRASGWYMEVGPAGETYHCCETFFSPRYRIGNLTETSVEGILEGQLRRNILEYIDSSFCTSCPPLCKPHELNKVFNSIETIKNKGQASLINQWRKDLMSYGTADVYHAGKLNDFES